MPATKTAVIAIRLSPEERRYLDVASEREAAEIATQMPGPSITLSDFVRGAAMEKARSRLRVTAAEFTKRQW